MAVSVLNVRSTNNRKPCENDDDDDDVSRDWHRRQQERKENISFALKTIKRARIVTAGNDNVGGRDDGQKKNIHISAAPVKRPRRGRGTEDEQYWNIRTVIPLYHYGPLPPPPTSPSRIIHISDTIYYFCDFFFFCFIPPRNDTLRYAVLRVISERIKRRATSTRWGGGEGTDVRDKSRVQGELSGARSDWAVRNNWLIGRLNVTPVALYYILFNFPVFHNLVSNETRSTCVRDNNSI